MRLAAAAHFAPLPLVLLGLVTLLLLSALGEGPAATILLASGLTLLPVVVVVTMVIAHAHACGSRLEPTAWLLEIDRIPPAGVPGMRIHYAPGVTYGVMAALLLSLIAFLLTTIGLPGWYLSGVMESPRVTGRAITLWLIALVALCALARLTWGIVRGTLARGWLALTPEGVVHRGWATTTILTWDNVREVTADPAAPMIVLQAVGAPAKRISHDDGGRLKWGDGSGTPHLRVPAGLLGLDPAVALHAIRYYHRVVEARAELADERAIRRLHACDFT
jgi:hypothetical protein